MINYLSSFYEIGRKVIVIVVVLLLIHLFVGTIHIVQGLSMWPTLGDHQLLGVQKIGYLWQSPQRGDIVVVRFPGDPQHTLYVKRIIGLPGEQVGITATKLTINGKVLAEPYLSSHEANGPERAITLGSGEYWLMGDNRATSNDSRAFGAVERRFIAGSAVISLWPLGPISTTYIY